MTDLHKVRRTMSDILLTEKERIAATRKWIDNNIDQMIKARRAGLEE